MSLVIACAKFLTKENSEQLVKVKIFPINASHIISSIKIAQMDLLHRIKCNQS